MPPATRNALEGMQAALQQDPRQAEVWYALAQAQAAAGELSAAIASLHEGLSYCSNQPDLLYLLANLLHQQGQLAEAIAQYQNCVRVAPGIVEAHLELSLALLKAGKPDPAETAARQALVCAPASATAFVNLGTILSHQGRYDEALQPLERGLALQPDNARTHNQLGMTGLQLGDSAKALLHFRQAVALQPDYAIARSNLMLALLYSDQVTAQDILAEAHRYGDAARPQTARAYVNTRDPQRQLRIGFVSSDFRQHVVALFLLPLFVNHNPANYAYYCYSLIDTPDDFTGMLARHASAWIDARPLNDAQLAARIESDRIDILIDLNGHTAGNRLPVFALRPAPVQATWLGFPGTTGVPGIDFRFTDDVLDPPGGEACSTETPVRLGNGFFCYVPPPEWGGSLPLSSLPAVRNGRITFGAFNAVAKVSPSCIEAWAEILRKTPGSTLVSRARCFETMKSRERFVQQFCARGVDAGRIVTMPYVPAPAQHMAIYNEIDIHLDSLPYAGGTTTCDALWMGVPVVTLAGDRPSARLGADVLTRLDLPEWIATCTADYVQIALELTQDRARLVKLRSTMRGRFVVSPLHNAPAFAREFEQACRGLWRRWCG